MTPEWGEFYVRVTRCNSCSDLYGLCSYHQNIKEGLEKEEEEEKSKTLYRQVPTSCACGGNTAWVKIKPSGAEEMVGCICHTFSRSSEDYDTLLRMLKECVKWLEKKNSSR